jgi:hypothetical protein
MADHLTDQNTRHWSGAEQSMTGLIRIDGKTYRYMGTHPRQYFALPEIPAMRQVRVTVMPLQTVYQFEQDGCGYLSHSSLRSCQKISM